MMLVMNISLKLLFIFLSLLPKCNLKTKYDYIIKKTIFLNLLIAITVVGKGIKIFNST